jgi:hypothetical protein
VDRNAIIAELFQEKKFNACVRAAAPQNLQEEVRSEVVLILLEKSSDKIISLHAAGTLLNYACMLVWRLSGGRDRRFAALYFKHCEGLDEIEVTANEEINYTTLEKIKSLSQQQLPNYLPEYHWYDQHIL